MNIPFTVDTRALGGNARNRFLSTGACGISNMVYWLNHGYILFIFIDNTKNNLNRLKIA